MTDLDAILLADAFLRGCGWVCLPFAALVAVAAIAGAIARHFEKD